MQRTPSSPRSSSVGQNPLHGGGDQNQPRSVPPRHSRGCSTSMGTAAFQQRWTLQQGKNDSWVVQAPFSRFHHICGMATLLAGSQSDGLHHLLEACAKPTKVWRH